MHVRAILVFLTFFFAPIVSAQDGTVFGVWLTEKSDKGASMAVEIFECGERVCGKSIDVFGTDKRDNVGIEIIKSMRKRSDRSYNKGKIYAPDTKKWYKSKMSLTDSGKLKVSGCVFGGVICRSQIWTRQ